MKPALQRASLGGLLLTVVLLSDIAQATLFQVGPTRGKKTLQSITTLVNPGDVVEVDGDVTYTNWTSFFRDGTAASPITIRGIRVNGHRPIISGSGIGAVHGLVAFRGDHYVFEGFEIDCATNNNITRGIYQVGDGVVIRDTAVRNCALYGIHGSDSAGSLTLDRVEVQHCGSGASYHQIYVASDNITHSNAIFRMQFCYIHDSNGGNNVKSRVGRNEIYYNWIEGADYHELDLIGADPTSQTTNTADLVREDSDVVGNVLCKSATSRGVVARLGDDGTGSSNGRYRFANNTVVLDSDYDTYVLRLRGPRESVELHNNVFVRVGGGALQFVDSADPTLSGDHRITGANNWLPSGSTSIPASLTGTRLGNNPRLVNVAAFDFMPTNASPLLDAGLLPTPSPVDYPFPAPLAAPLYLPPLRVPLENGTPAARPDDGEIDIGALESPALPPEILTQPTAVTKLQGQTATFAVSAGGSLTNTNPLGYQWFFNGAPIGDATNINLTLTATETSAAGDYQVVATNTFGSATSTAAALTVNLDTNKPSVAIAAPPDKTIFLNESLTLTGSASDNARVSGVFASVGDTNHWQPVSDINQPAPNTASWTNHLTLAVGTNKIYVKSVDFTGRESAFASRSLFFSVRSPFTLQTNGNGAIGSSPNVSGMPTNGATLEITKNFLVTAAPAVNWVFSNWLASANGEPWHEVSTMVKFPFAMQSNLTLVAQFVTNQFIGAAGNYRGLFSESNQVAQHSAGFFSLKTDARRQFSGSLSLGGETAAFSGSFNLAGDGFTTRPITFRTTNTALTVRLHLPFDGSDTISGSVSNQDSSWVSTLRGNRTMFSATSPATNFAGQYTLVIPSAPDDDAVPGGDGFGTVKIATSGSISLAGRLGDGTFLKQSVPLARNGEWPLFCTAYPTLSGGVPVTSGMIWGWLTVSNGVSGIVVWIKKPASGDTFYPDGFTSETNVSGSVYLAPGSGVRAIALTNGTTLLTGGNLSQPLNNNVAFSTLNQFTPSTNHGLVLKLATKTGLLTGGFANPDNTNAPTSIYGVVLQNAGTGHGFFKGTDQTGNMRLEAD